MHLCIAWHMSTLPSEPALVLEFTPPQLLHHHQLPLLLPHNASHRNGRLTRISFRPCLRTLWVGLAKSGQRRAEGPPLGWIKFGPDFLCRSRLTQLTLGAIRKATGICRHLVISITKIIDWLLDRLL